MNNSVATIAKKIQYFDLDVISNFYLMNLNKLMKDLISAPITS